MKGWKIFLGGILTGLLLTGLFRLVNLPHNDQTFTLVTATADLTPKPDQSASLIRVHVTGAVLAPGIYSLPEGATLQQAIDAAKGPSALSRPDLLNLATILTDGQRIYIPSDGDKEATNMQRGQEIDMGGLININTASQELLETLPGIGQVKAQAIISHRTANGYFLSIEDIMTVNGIGKSTFEEIRELITVSP